MRKDIVKREKERGEYLFSMIRSRIRKIEMGKWEKLRSFSEVSEVGHLEYEY